MWKTVSTNSKATLTLALKKYIKNEIDYSLRVHSYKPQIAIDMKALTIEEILVNHYI